MSIRSCHGYFEFGGSDFVMLSQKDAGFQLTAPGNDTDGYQHVLLGETFRVPNAGP